MPTPPPQPDWRLGSAGKKTAAALRHEIKAAVYRREAARLLAEYEADQKEAEGKERVTA